MNEKDVLQSTGIIETIRDHCGKDAAVYDDVFFRKSVQRRMAALEKEENEYLRFLKESKTESDILLSSLNITFSQFFRNPLTFALLEQLILPRLLSKKTEGGEIRIWSAGCATGQEAYSLAILLEELIAVSSRPIRYRIFATDIAEEALHTAKAGSYDEGAVANLKWSHLKKYFSRVGEVFTVNEAIKEKIDFSVFNLLDSETLNPPGSIFGDFDIICCCNLLFYYQMAVRRQIVRKLKRSLAEAGFLITGEAEAEFLSKDSDLKMLDSKSAIFQINKK